MQQLCVGDRVQFLPRQELEHEMMANGYGSNPTYIVDVLALADKVFTISLVRDNRSIRLKELHEDESKQFNWKIIDKYVYLIDEVNVNTDIPPMFGDHVYV